MFEASTPFETQAHLCALVYHLQTLRQSKKWKPKNNVASYYSGAWSDTRRLKRCRLLYTAFLKMHYADITDNYEAGLNQKSF